MRNTILGLTIFACLFSTSIQAHEGHDKTPGAVSAPHGGVVKGTSQIYLELVNEAGGIKVYPLTHDSSPIALKEVTIKGTATFPKKAKGEPVSFASGDDHFAAKVNAKGAYRYSLDLTVTYKGKQEKITFQVEPQG